jgi:glutamyl-tRNA synthetase
MLLSNDGRRLSKRDKDLDFSQLRSRYQPEEIIGLLAYLCGLIPKWEKVSAKELVPEFSWEKVKREDIRINLNDL